MRKPHSLFILIFCLIIALALPFLTAAAQNHRLESSVFPFSDEIHYAYRGTLSNRVLALDAYFNSSPAVRGIISPSGIPNSDIAAPLAAFLPTGDFTPFQSSALVITPKQYSAEYRFIITDYAVEGVSLQIISDEETSLPLRIELHIAPEIMMKFISSADTWSILQQYVDLLGLGEAADVYYSESTLLVTRTAPIRGVPYSAELTAIPSTGALLIKLNAVSQN